MVSRKNRIIIDTNLWISYLLTDNLIALDEIFANKQSIILFSQNLLDEFVEVAQRRKFKKYFSLADLERLLMQLRNETEFIDVTSNIQLCRDPKDDFLLSLAKDGKATHLITGDKDLLAIKTFGSTKIITISDYKEG
jgi:uncharacterized protein